MPATSLVKHRDIQYNNRLEDFTFLQTKHSWPPKMNEHLKESFLNYNYSLYIQKCLSALTVLSIVLILSIIIILILSYLFPVEPLKTSVQMDSTQEEGRETPTGEEPPRTPEQRDDPAGPPAAPPRPRPADEPQVRPPVGAAPPLVPVLEGDISTEPLIPRPSNPG